MKDLTIPGAIVFLAIAVFFTGGMRPLTPSQPDQYVVNEGKIYRFPGSAPGRVEVFEKNAQGKQQLMIAK